MGSESYAIRVVCVNDSGALPGEPIMRYFRPMGSNYKKFDVSKALSVGSFLSINDQINPILFEDKEEAIIMAHEVQIRLDMLRTQPITMFKSNIHYIEYFTRVVKFDPFRYVLDCVTATRLVDVDDKVKREQAKIKGVEYYKHRENDWY